MAGHLSVPPFTLHSIVGAQTRDPASRGSSLGSSEKRFKLAYELGFFSRSLRVWTKKWNPPRGSTLHNSVLLGALPVPSSLCVPACCYSGKLPLLYTALQICLANPSTLPCKSPHSQEAPSKPTFDLPPKCLVWYSAITLVCLASSSTLPPPPPLFLLLLLSPPIPHVHDHM